MNSTQSAPTASPQIAAASRRQQIVSAAWDLLDSDGLEGLTIRAVLGRTGLARRAFYDEFAGKDDLVLAVFALSIQMAADLFGQQVATIPDALDRLRFIVLGIVLGRTATGEGTSHSGKRGAAMSREHLRLGESHPAQLQAAIAPLIALIARQLEDGMAAGSVRKMAPQRLAALVYNLVSTTVHAELLTETDHDPKSRDRHYRQQLADDLWEFCHRAVMV